MCRRCEMRCGLSRSEEPVLGAVGALIVGIATGALAVTALTFHYIANLICLVMDMFLMNGSCLDHGLPKDR